MIYMIYNENVRLCGHYKYITAHIFKINIMTFNTSTDMCFVWGI